MSLSSAALLCLKLSSPFRVVRSFFLDEWLPPFSQIIQSRSLASLVFLKFSSPFTKFMFSDSLVPVYCFARLYNSQFSFNISSGPLRFFTLFNPLRS